MATFSFKWSRGSIYNSSYYHHQIGSIYLSHCCHIFPRLCAWDGCTIICWQFHIYPGKVGFCVFYYCAVLWCAQIIELIMQYDLIVVFVSLHITLPHYHHHADLTECIELLKFLSCTFCLGCVSKIQSVLSIIKQPPWIPDPKMQWHIHYILCV